MEEYNLIEINNKTYVVTSKVVYNEQEYYLLSKIEDEVLYDEMLIGLVKNNRFLPVEDEEELANIKKELLLEVKKEM